MKVLFELGSKSVEVEDTIGVYATAGEKALFLDLLDSALDAMGITGEDLMDHWTLKSVERDNAKTEENYKYYGKSFNDTE